MQMGHDKGGNPNIHTWACPGGHIATNRGTGIFVPLSSFRESKADRSLNAAHDMTDLHYHTLVFNNLLRKDILVPEQCDNCTTIIIITGATFLGIGIPSNVLIT